MPAFRPSATPTKALIRRSTANRQATHNTTRHISSTPVRQGGHAPHYDQPTGWLFGVPPGTKPKKESWENMAYYGYGGALLLTVVAYAYKPDTSIQTWALEEARRRLEKEGILEDPNPDHTEED